MIALIEPKTPQRKLPRVLKRVLIRSFHFVLCTAVVFCIYVAVTSYRYGVPLSVAAEGILRSIALGSVQTAVAVYDPCEPKLASTGPNIDSLPNRADYDRIEEILPPNQERATPSGHRLTAQASHNERIVRSPFVFRYQPYDEPRLHELRRKYHFDEVVAPAKNEFEAMVLLRNWTRSQFRRSDYQPAMNNFDALEILDRNLRNHGEPYEQGGHIDPCTLYPMMYCQVLLSMGYQARLASVNHGVIEVWSNLHRKWVFMDAELNHHFEKGGVPLNMVELHDEYHGQTASQVQLRRGEQSSGDVSTTMVHLHIEHPTAGHFLPMFGRSLDVADMRNDWMTNHYFRGHPARSEANSLTFMDPTTHEPLDFRRRWRSVTTSKDEFYWTLNQTEIWAARGANEVVELAFNTVTPNFEYFEVVVDGNVQPRSEGSKFQWHLHSGTNRLVVRAVNQFGARGIESTAELLLSD